MAVRIPVVVSQHERRSGAMADYEEKLITQLIFENGLDATLVADLKSIDFDTTDHLCIEGLKGDFALATWQTKDYVCQHLHRLGIPSLVIVPVDGSARMESNSDGSRPKSIYFISLSTETPIEKTIGTLREIRTAKSTPVVSIGVPKNRVEPVEQASVKAPRLSPEPASTSASEVVLSESRKQDFVPAVESKTLGQSEAMTTDLSDDFPNIDQLMDDLDQFKM